MKINKKKNKGFTLTPILASLLSFLNIFLQKNKFLIKTIFRSSEKLSSKKTMPKLVSGFTLIELMVATSIFVVIMLSSMSALFILLNAAKTSRALRTAMDNVNFSMESMTRSIRMGHNYYCATSSPSDLTSTQDCPSGESYITFVPQEDKGHRVAFRWTTSQYDNTKHVLQRCEGVLESDCVDIVAKDVDIENLKFFVKNPAPDDGAQASVYIIMKGTVTVKGVPTSFPLQTIASQRNY